MPPADAETRATTAGKWLFAAVVPASALALGSVPTAALVVMATLAAVACALLWWDGHDANLSKSSRAVLVAMAVLCGMTFLQAIPVPDSIAHALSPTDADIWQRALHPLREDGPAWHTISVTPGATRVELLKGLLYASIFLGALRILRREHGERFLIRLVVFSSSLMALVALAHAAVGAERIFGIYRPHELWAYREGRFSPLLNTNHLAAYLNIGACVSFSVMLDRSMMPRALSGVAMLILVATSLWQSSRGATATLCFGVVLVVVLAFYTRRRFDSARAQGAIAAACLVAATATVALSLSGGSSNLLRRDVVKLTVAQRSWSLFRESPWVGYGRGAFESIFSSVREGPTYVTFTHPEDLLVQWLVEWGLPISLVCLALLAWAMRPQTLLRAVRPAVGAWVAVIVATLHELVDYHFEVPGVTALVTVCLAMVVGGRVSSRAAAPSSTRASTLRRLSLATSAVTIAVMIAAIPEVGHSLAEERRRLAALALDHTASSEAFRGSVRSAMLRFPAEPFLPLMGAVRAQVMGEGSVVPWVGRALERDPRFGRAHFILARSLVQSHPAQARLEYRMAYLFDAELREAVVKDAALTVTDATTALELVPDGPSGNELLESLVVGLASRLPSTAEMLDEELAKRAPTAEGPLQRRAEAAAHDAVEGAPWCGDREACARNALEVAREVARREPTECSAHVRVAKIRLSLEPRAAGPVLDDLERASAGVADHGVCQRELINLCFSNGQQRRGELEIDRLLRGGCGVATDCVDLYTWAGGTEEGQGHALRAIHLYRRALDIAPDREDLLQRIGSLGEQGQVVSEALDAYRTLSLRHPEDPQWAARVEQLKARVVGAAGTPTLPTIPPDEPPAPSAEP